MNKLLLISAIIFSLYCNAQLKIENNQLIYQQVFETNKTINEAQDYFALDQNIEDLKLTNNALSFKVEDDKINLGEYGLKVMSTPIYVQGDLYYNGKIEFKDQKYRVTLSRINTSTPTLGKSELNKFFVKKNEIKQSKQAQKYIPIFEQHFKNKFTINNNNNNDW